MANFRTIPEKRQTKLFPYNKFNLSTSLQQLLHNDLHQIYLFVYLHAQTVHYRLFDKNQHSQNSIRLTQTSQIQD